MKAVYTLNACYLSHQERMILWGKGIPILIGRISNLYFKSTRHVRVTFYKNYEYEIDYLSGSGIIEIYFIHNNGCVDLLDIAIPNGIQILEVC